MNTKITIAASFLALFTMTSQLHAQYGNMRWDESYQESLWASPVHSSWQASFTEVPRLLQMHLPKLPPGQGVLVREVHPYGIAAIRHGLQVGDILLSIEGKPLAGVKSLPLYANADIVVLRHGVQTTLSLQKDLPKDKLEAMLRAQNFPNRGAMNYSQPAMGGVSASAFSSGNESVSVSQNGDQLTLEMSLPELESAPIRFQGTRQSIRQQVKNSRLSPAARQRVLATIK